MSKPTKYIFVTGGVLSGLGKGITAAALGTVLKARGLKVNLQKCDPYLNTDAGTLNPAEHGEVFVTKDGAETDLDLGHYERFLDEELTRSSSLIAGRVYGQVIADERAGKYLGKTVQIIPHVTGEIKREILASSQGFDVHIVEIGGTVGDIESLPFMEAIRQLKHEVGSANVLYAHVIYLPYLEASHELKTKPAQNTVRDLREAGVQPDVIFARAEHPITEHIMRKLWNFCDVEMEAIVALPTAKSVYEVPLILEASKIDSYICKQLGLKVGQPKLGVWRKLVKQILNERPAQIKIGVVAKYMNHEDTYMSVFEALRAAAWAQGLQVDICWVNAEKLEETEVPEELLAGLAGLVVPGGFGARGVEGKVLAATYAMGQAVPYLGLCLGMQVAVIAMARQSGLKGANSLEVDGETPAPVIALMADQETVVEKGGTMRLGNYPCVLTPGTRTAKAYGSRRVEERHRHRYEFNNKYRGRLESKGLVVAGQSPDGRLVEIVELAEHPFFVGSQFHPEFTSRPGRPHPLFAAFVAAAAERAGVKQGGRTGRRKVTV